MGCDIHSFAERRNKATKKWLPVQDAFTLDDYDREYYGKEKGSEPFPNRDYSLFAFLAGVRNYDCLEPISEPRGIPDDISDFVKEELDKCNRHSTSYISLRELMEFDYEKTFWNRRVTKQTGPNSFTGAGLAEEGEGRVMTYRETLGEFYFKTLEELKAIGDPDDVRVVFWFDN